MVYKKYSIANNAICSLDLEIDESTVTLNLAGNYGRLPASNFIIKVTEYDTDGTTVIGRENMYVTTRTGAVCTGVTRAYEEVPIDDDAATNIQQALPFAAGSTVEGVSSAEVAEDIQNEVTRLETDKLNVSDYQNGTKVYGATSVGTDAYAITLSPAIGAYAVGQTFRFLSDVANTGAATLNVNGLGAKTIKKLRDQDLASGDIEAGQIVMVSYDGTNFQMDSQIATIPTTDVNGLSEKTFEDDDDASLEYDSVGLQNVKVKAKYRSLRAKKQTASGAILANDVVYPTAANIVKTIYPSAQGTGAAVSTNPDHRASTKSKTLSTSGRYLHITGGDDTTAALLYAQVRTINAAESDFTNGTEVTVYGTGNGTRHFDVCEIDTDKFLIVFQASTAGAAAGIKAVVITVSGTTVTVGAVVTLEATGSLTAQCSCAKVDTDKALITYREDDDTDIYCKVVTVATTTITQFTGVVIKVTASTIRTVSTQLTTNTVLVAYSANSNLFGVVVTISGTTPTVGSEQTIKASSGSYMIGIARLSATKAFIVYGDDGGGAFNDTCANLAISGSTITASSELSIGATRITKYYGIHAISANYVLVMDYESTTSMKLYFLNTSGTAPTSVSNQALSTSAAATNLGISVVKVAPWTYMVGDGAGQNDSDYIVKLTPVSTAIVGTAEAAISDTALGIIALRGQIATLTGLTAASLYYVDDSGQPTTKSSVTALTLRLGVSLSTTLLLQA